MLRRDMPPRAPKPPAPTKLIHARRIGFLTWIASCQTPYGWIGVRAWTRKRAEAKARRVQRNTYRLAA